MNDFYLSMKAKLYIYICVLALSCLISFGKCSLYDNYNYQNSDATWHVLLTMNAYDETSSSIHRFLPIVSLGEPQDKSIPWGKTVPDHYGNYYYTSFTNAGFIAPYLFLKVFRLPITQQSLYVFNTVLYCISNILLAILLINVFGNSFKGVVSGMLSLLLYCTSPIVLHGMGIVYWHHSIMQCTLLLQLLMYLKMEESKTCRYAFFITCLFNPYIEWTGFIANFGYAIAEMYIIGKRNMNGNKKGIIHAACILAFTCISFGVMCLYYVHVIGLQPFFDNIFNRFSARSVASIRFSLMDLICSYFGSFNLFLFAFFILFVVLTMMNKGFSWLKECTLWTNRLLLFAVSIPILENLIMMGHAVTYPYDQMKAGFLLALCVCDLTHVLLERLDRTALRRLSLIILTIIGILNYFIYINNPRYKWPVDYTNENRLLSEYLDDHFNDCIVGSNTSVRGYVNLLFHRGIYECIEKEDLIEIAQDRSAKYAVYLKGLNMQWDMNRFLGAYIIDLKSGEECLAVVKDDVLLVRNTQ